MIPVTTFAAKTVAVFGLALGACGVETPLDARALCAANAARLEIGHDAALLEFIAAQFKVEKTVVRFDENGVFVPRSTFFVEERGYFIANPGVRPPGREADPSFAPVESCLYRYLIKG